MAPAAQRTRHRPVGRLAIACGGTLGHVLPALAVADAWAAAVPSAPPLLCTVRGEDEHALVRRSGHERAALSASRFRRTGSLGRAQSVARLVRGTGEALAFLSRADVGAVLALGGYAGPALVVAARARGLPAFAHEANARAGLATRFCVRCGAKPLLAFHELRQRWPAAPVVGVPLAPSAVPVASDAKAPSASVVVAGGSEGSATLNAMAPQLLSALAPASVLHQCGAHDPAPIAAAYSAAGVSAEVVPWVEHLGARFFGAPLVIACAGAVTLAELARAHALAVLVPRDDVADGHQQANARALKQRGACWVVDSTADLRAEATRLAAFSNDGRAVAVMRDALRSFYRADAAQAIVTNVLARMAG